MKSQNRSISEQFSITMWHIATFALLLFCITTVVPAQTVEQIARKALAATVYLEMKDDTGETLGFGKGNSLYEEAIDTYTSAIRSNLDSVIALYNRGLANSKGRSEIRIRELGRRNRIFARL